LSLLEADSISPTNIKRITTVYPNTDNHSSTTGTFIKTVNGNNSMISPPAKRRRSESSTNHPQLPIQSSDITTVTLDQLKVQYGNVSVSNRMICSFSFWENQFLLNRKKH